MGKHNELGIRGERLAAAHLEKKGFTILRRNYRYLKAEVDIIARKGNTLAIVEVKSRTSEDFEPIAGTVSKKKIRLLVLAADHFVIEEDCQLEVRFDIIAVYFKKQGIELTHLENAFYYF